MTERLREQARAWMSGDPDDETRAELARVIDGGDEKALADRVGRGLQFGTAGLRGLIGAGPNRMNRAVVIRTSAGIAHHLLATVPGARQRGVVVGYDARRMSRAFAEDAARVFAGEGFTVWLADSVVPTPIVAFATPHLGAAAGVMITASHNPAEYNGYKVYWTNGAQIAPPTDERIAAEIDRVGPANQVPRDGGLRRPIPPAVEQAYLDGVCRLLIKPAVRPPIKIVYTPLHGVGYETAIKVLARAGFSNVVAVPEQVRPDPSFPTVHFPNPEEKGAMDLAFALARIENADLIVANDPDADRLAVAVRSGSGQIVQLSGNQLGTLLGHYLLTAAGAEARNKGRIVITTVVSSPMLGRIARDHGAHYEETLTGFKWMANRAMALEAEGKGRAVLCYEEALGYAVGDLVRDKDGMSAAAVFAEIVAVCRAEGTTVLDVLERLYRRYGLFASSQRVVLAEGEAGLAQFTPVFDRLRSEPPAEIGGRDVTRRLDYLTGRVCERGGRISKTDLPPNDVMAFELAGEGRVVIRPSGTEPKVKLYFDHREEVADGEPIARAEARAARAITRIEDGALRFFEVPR
jgi:phosphomannomutase